MEAAFEGTLVLRADKCITGKTTQGQDMGLIFLPAPGS